MSEVSSSSNKSISESADPVDMLKTSVSRYGQIYPIVKDQYGIIDGFHRDLIGCRDVKTITTKDLKEHYVLRFQLNYGAKDSVRRTEDLKKCVGELARLIKQEKPMISQEELWEEVGSLLGLSAKTIKNYYLPEEYKRSLSLGRDKNRKTSDTLPVERAKVLRIVTEKLWNLKDDNGEPLSTEQVLEEKKWAREILRDEKPPLKTKDDIDRFYELFVRKPGTPSDIFVRSFYLLKGPNGLGWRPELPWWYRYALEEITGENPEKALYDLLAQKIAEAKRSVEDYVSKGKEELKKQWAL
ncbi:MAG: ParB/RepB/Spo0J family partition protein [Sulfolobales archaeon]